jgi:transposase-like protein
MARRGSRVSLAEKLEISEKTLAGKSDPEIAKELERSVHTVRKWRRQFTQHGRSGLESRMGRPVSGILGSYRKDLREAILKMRKAHPGWGPKTLLMELRQDQDWGARKLPSRARVAALLHQEDLVREYERHIDLPQPEREDVEKPHQVWQMDAQGSLRVKGLRGRTSVIHVIDVYSRLKVESCPRTLCRKPGRNDDFLALRKAFLQFGLPQRISLDHDTVFIDNTLASPYPTRIHLWLVALGIEVAFTRKRRPTDHAQVERSHQTMTAQAIQGQTWDSELQLWAGLDQRRERLNQHFPLQILGEQAPLQAYPEAISSGRTYRPEWEEQLLSLQRVYQFLAEGRWIRTSQNHKINLGGFRYSIGTNYGHQDFEITFDPGAIVFQMQPEQGGDPISIPPKGLTKADLMGDLKLLLDLPAYQLAFPFTPTDRHRTSLAQFLAGTTL